MADKDYKAFIVEGEAREPQVIDNISKVFFKHGNLKIITLPAGENIYMLWKKLKADDFDTDIIEVLRESNKKIREQLEGLSRDDFSEVFLFFDYDVHQTNLGKADDGDVINQMLESFDNETENGKLYISYPMVEALRDFEAGKCGNGDNCFVEISVLAEYKNISSRNSLNPHFRDYNIDVWKEIVDVFLMRISCLLGNAEVISYEQYLDEARGTDNLIGPPFEILSDKAVKYYEKLKDKGENVYIDSLTYEQFMVLGDAELSRRFSMQDEAEQKAKIDREQANELEYVDESQKSDAADSANASNGSAGAKPVRNPEREKPKWEDTITNRMLHWSYTLEQKEEVKKALAAGVPKATILTYFYPEVTVEKMSTYRKKQ